MRPNTEPGRSQRLELLTVLKRSAGGLTVKELATHFGMSYMGVKQHCLLLERDGYVDTRRRSKGIGRPELVYHLTDRAHELFQQRRSVGGTPNHLTRELLDASSQAYGPNAPGKLLFNVYQRRAVEYRKQLAEAGEDILDSAAALARLRDDEGYMAVLETDGDSSKNVEAASGRLPPVQIPFPSEENPPPDEPAEPAADEAYLEISTSEAGPAQPAESAAHEESPILLRAPAPPTYIRIVEHQSPVEELLRDFPILARLERELFERVLERPVRREDESKPGYYRCVFEIGL